MDIYWDEHNQFFPVDNRTLVGYSRKSNNRTYNGRVETYWSTINFLSKCEQYEISKDVITSEYFSYNYGSPNVRLKY